MDSVRYTYEDLYGHIRAAFKKMGCSEGDTFSNTTVLMSAEMRGIPSHGIIRLKDYIQMWKNGRINPRPDMRLIHETSTTAVLDADQAFGAVAGIKAMKIAMKKASKYQTGWVAVKNSSHFSIAGYYAMMALKKDMIGISMTNANPVVAPTFSVDRLLGTNPLAAAIPAGKEPPFIADFATTPIARGKLAIMERDKKEAPEGYLQTSAGYPSTNPGIINEGGAILPLGGDYEHGSYKGSAMSALVDIFSSVLPGANFGPFVPPQIPRFPEKENAPGKGLGHFFGAMRIDGFQPADDFKNYMDQWIRTYRNARPSPGNKEVLVPGEPERRYEIKYRNEGIPVPQKVIHELGEAYGELGLNFNL